MIGRAVEALGEQAMTDDLGSSDASHATWLKNQLGEPPIRTVRQVLRMQRSEFMTPWPEPPQSIASGILDDETYDWLAIVEAMMDTGGHPVVVPDELIAQATDLAGDATGIDVSHTGAAGLAGLLGLVAGDDLESGEHIAVVLTGQARRAPSAAGA